MAIGFNNRKESFVFPVLPENIELKRNGRGTTHDIVGLGQINALHSRDLAEISFESFFPVMRHSFVSELQYASPADYVNNLNRWQESGYPCRFIFTGPTFPINLPVSIEQFDRWEEAGSPGDIHYRLSLKEYVFHGARKVREQQVDPRQRPDERVRPATYTMKSGDTLIGISRQLFGTSARWRDIQKANAIPDSRLRQLPVGTVLRIPKE